MESFDASTLIQTVREDANLGPPTANSFPTDAVILRWLNEEMKNCVSPALMKPREERFVALDPFTTVANQPYYAIPERSQWSDLRDVQVYCVGSSPAQWWSLRPMRPEQAAGWVGGWFAVPNAQYPAGYYIEADSVVVWPAPPSAYVMRIKYFLRPGRIVSAGYSAPNSVGLVSTTYVVGVASTTGMASGNFDILAPDFPCKTLAMSLPGTVADGTTLNFVAADLTDEQIAVLEVAADEGYLFIAAGDAPCPQIPQDVVPLLTARATYRAAKQKNKDGWKDLLLAAEALESKLLNAYEVRADGLPQTAVVTNAPGMGGPIGWQGWGYGSAGGQ